MSINSDYKNRLRDRGKSKSDAGKFEEITQSGGAWGEDLWSGLGAQAPSRFPALTLNIEIGERLVPVEADPEFGFNVDLDETTTIAVPVESNVTVAGKPHADMADENGVLRDVYIQVDTSRGDSFLGWADANLFAREADVDGDYGPIAEDVYMVDTAQAGLSGNEGTPLILDDASEIQLPEGTILSALFLSHIEGNNIIWRVGVQNNDGSWLEGLINAYDLAPVDINPEDMQGYSTSTKG